jgi:muramoyltetrapeptide carboxypeptidase
MVARIAANLESVVFSAEIPPVLSPRLHRSDVVAIVALSSPFDRARFEAGLAILRGFGLVARYDDRLFARQRYLAGSDAQRLALWEEAVADPEVKALWCVRGGYGAVRILPQMQLNRLIERPRLLIGFSDITGPHTAANALGLVTVHGPVITQLGEQSLESLERLWALLTVPGSPDPLAANPALTISPGVASGRLLGGNLEVLSRLVGTPWQPSMEGAILLIEETGERPYRIDRAWTHLKMSGAFRGIKGVAVGDLTGCEEKDADYTALDVVRDLVAELGVPAAAGFPVGHGAVHQAIPLGVNVRLDANAARLTFSTGAVQ